MSIIPRWRYMTDESKAIVKTAAIGTVSILIGLTLVRALFPWIMLGLAVYGCWCLFSRRKG